MFIQGDLQMVFDALYEVGAINPVLKLDWAKISKEVAGNPSSFQQAMKSLNSCGGDKKLLIESLHNMDQKLVNYIAVEVARELAEFTDRQVLH